MEVTGPRQKSTIPDMGMEIPCVLTFTHSDPHLLEKAKKLLAIKGFEDKHEPRKDPEDKPKYKKGSEGENNPKPKKRQKRNPVNS